ncbi:hypothetical protein E1140_19260 [Fulvivirga lutimaris]|nr:hypothetical protein [Fulvivirga lutimaris]
MGDKINSEGGESYPTITPDGKYLLFNKSIDESKADIYWVDAKIIEELRYESNRPPLKDRYFGEEPPGLTPKPFAPDFVSPDGLFEEGSYTPDMKTYYFTRKNKTYDKRKFFVIRYENNKWGNESETEIRWPNFSEDGNTMYLGKEYRQRTETGWSELKSHGDFLKDQAHGMAVSPKGTFYFAVYKEEDEGINGSLYYSRFVDGKQEIPVKMSSEINTGIYIAHPYVSSDESYLIWDVERKEGYGQSDIYISFRDTDGNWQPAKNMGHLINTSIQESSPRVTPDGKYFFFIRGEWKERTDGSTYYVGKQHWVDAKVIENLRP